MTSQASITTLPQRRSRVMSPLADAARARCHPDDRRAPALSAQEPTGAGRSAVEPEPLLGTAPRRSDTVREARTTHSRIRSTCFSASARSTKRSRAWTKSTVTVVESGSWGSPSSTFQPLSAMSNMRLAA